MPESCTELLLIMQLIQLMGVILSIAILLSYLPWRCSECCIPDIWDSGVKLKTPGVEPFAICCRTEAHGTCWHECRCDGAGNCAFAENQCVDFSCDNARWRRQPGKNACVQDHCTQVRLRSQCGRLLCIQESSGPKCVRECLNPPRRSLNGCVCAG